LKKFASTVRNHRELLFNYFRARKAFSSGVIEGLNNKAKVTMRKAYGFLRTFKATELALYHVLGKLPEPALAHRFRQRGIIIAVVSAQNSPHWMEDVK
jgi:transposase